MAEDPIDVFGLPDRQRKGYEYSKANDLPEVQELTLDCSDWKIRTSGKLANPPEMGNLPYGAPVVLYDLQSFEITNQDSGKSIDLTAATPSGWKQKTVASPSPDFAAPEVLREVNAQYSLNPDVNEIITGEFPRDHSHSPTDIVKITTWYTLCAKFLENVGEPANDDLRKAMLDQLTQRRQEVLDALAGKTDEDPQVILARPFTQG